MPKVYVGLCGDIVHGGHINIIKKASRYGQVTVGLLTDKAISSYKSPPIMTYKERYAVISQMKGVFNVVAQNSLDYSANLRKLTPDFVIHAKDWKDGIQSKTRENVIKVLREWNGKLIEVKYTKGISSSIIKERIRNG